MIMALLEIKIIGLADSGKDMVMVVERNTKKSYTAFNKGDISSFISITFRMTFILMSFHGRIP